jgi:hypothetical protein
MHNGLKPSVRSFKGVGFNRALPSAFDFGNAVVGDGVNDELRGDFTDIEGIERITVEMFVNKKDLSFREGFLLLQVNGTGVFTLSSAATTGKAEAYFGNSPTGGTSIDASIGFCHYIWMFDFVNKRIRKVVNPTPNNISAQPWGVNQSALPGVSAISAVRYLKATASHDLNAGVYARGKNPIGDIRVYKELLTDDQLFLNYNGGIGENPCVTEHLLWWHKMEAYEAVDYSSGKDGSDLRPSIKDSTPNNRHVYAVNMITDPTNAAYTIKPFYS